MQSKLFLWNTDMQMYVQMLNGEKGKRRKRFPEITA